MIKNKYEEKVKYLIEMNEKEKNKIIENINELNFKIENYKEIKNKKIRKNVDI